jgi:hypothetical protein
MGAGYLTGAYFFTRLALARGWHRAGRPLPGVATFAATIMLVTVLYWDRFNHGTLSFVTWVVVYAVAPPLVVIIWWRNRQTDPGLPDDGDVLVPTAVRAALAVIGVILLACALAMFLRPNLAIDHWPWRLSQATARAIAGWIALPGAAALSLAPDRRWSAWRMPIEGTFLWAALIAAAIPRAWSDFSSGGVGHWITVVVVSLWLAALATLYGGMERRRRRALHPATPGLGETALPNAST